MRTEMKILSIVTLIIEPGLYEINAFEDVRSEDSNFSTHMRHRPTRLGVSLRAGTVSDKTTLNKQAHLVKCVHSEKHILKLRHCIC